MVVNHHSNINPMAGLTRQVAVAYLLFLLGGFALLGLFFGCTRFLPWLAGGGIILIFQLWRFNRAAVEEHRITGSPPARLGLANRITLLRGILLAFLGGMVFLPVTNTPLKILAGVLYSLAALADYADGFVARRRRETSRIGERLDGEFDALGILLVPLLGVKFGQLPLSYLLVSAAYYLFQAGIWLRRRREKPVYPLIPSDFRRMLAAFQMGFLAVILFPVYRPPATTIAAYVFMTPFLLMFLHDWLTVSGWLRPESAFYRNMMRWVFVPLQEGLPLLFRVLCVAIVSGPALQKFLDYSGQVAFFQEIEVGYPGFMVIAVGIIELLTVLLILLGIAGRIAALSLMFVMGAAIMFAELNWGNGIILISTIGLVILGSGRFSLWAPEETFLRRRAGGDEG